MGCEFCPFNLGGGRGLTFVQGCSAQLPRGWCHSICDDLEARVEGGEGLDG